MLHSPDSFISRRTKRAQIAADMAELEAKHTVRFRGLPMADLEKKWKVTPKTLRKVAKRFQTQGTPKLTTRKGTGGCPMTIREDEEKRIADVLKTNAFKIPFAELALETSVPLACLVHKGGARQASRRDLTSLRRT